LGCFCLLARTSDRPFRAFETNPMSAEAPVTVQPEAPVPDGAAAAAAAGAGAGAVGDTPPNQTIYINNLNEKIKKDGPNFCSSIAGRSIFCY